MKLLPTILWIFIIAVFTNACHNTSKNEFTNSDGNLVVEELFSNDQPKIRTIYLNKEKTDYILTTYYESGEVMDSARYKDGIVVGKRVYYDREGDLLHVEHYKNGILDGVNKGIYGDGTTSYEGFRVAGKKAGEWIFHYPDGGPITYEFYDTTGKLLFFRKYDETGRFEKTNGQPFIFIHDVASPSPDGTYLVHFVVVDPPLSSNRVEVIDPSIRDSGNIIGSSRIKTVRSEVPVSVSESGNKSLEFFFRSENIKTGEVQQFSQTRTINFPEI